MCDDATSKVCSVPRILCVPYRMRGPSSRAEDSLYWDMTQWWRDVANHHIRSTLSSGVRAGASHTCEAGVQSPFLRQTYQVRRWVLFSDRVNTRESATAISPFDRSVLPQLIRLQPSPTSTMGTVYVAPAPATGDLVACRRSNTAFEYTTLHSAGVRLRPRGKLCSLIFPCRPKQDSILTRLISYFPFCPSINFSLSLHFLPANPFYFRNDAFYIHTRLSFTIASIDRPAWMPP